MRTSIRETSDSRADRDTRAGVSTTSFDLGMIELLADDPAAAERALRADYDALVQLGATYVISTMGAGLARAGRAQGRDEGALALTRTAEAAAHDDDVEAQVLWRATRAPIRARAGQLAEAEARARAAHEKSRETEMPSLRGFALTELASVLQRAGRTEEARAALEEAVAIYELKGDIASAELTKRLLMPTEGAA